MQVCRICLSSAETMDVDKLQSKVQEGHKSCSEMILFCLNIQITEETSISKKLCLKCYKKIIAFYKFKWLALENDAYLRSLDTEVVKHEVFVQDSSHHEGEIRALDGLAAKIKEELEIKDEDNVVDSQSDDEFLSVIKMIKYEYVAEETHENVENQFPVKKRRGRPKILKTKIQDKEVCEECGKAVRNLKEHSYRHQPLRERRRIKCKACDKLFTTYGARYKHYKIKHLGMKQHCNICNKDVVNVKHHHLVVHDTARLPFGCVPCGRRFVSRSTLDIHMTTHSKDRPHQCDVCHKTYRSKVVLSLHKRQVHDKEKSHLCQFCSKSFFKKYHLLIHLRSHTKEKPHACPECGKRFATGTTLRNHRLIHSGVKAFQCAHCDTSFAKPGYLRAHMICHTKEKRHACKYCGVAFGRSDHRKRHERTAHEKHLVTSA